MKTARGVYHDLTESEYFYTVDDMIFIFSSLFYRDKFANIYEEEIERFNQALNNVYKDKFSIYGDKLALIRLYAMIEKRGFYLIIGGFEVKCLEDLAFVVMPNLKNKSDD